MSRIGKRVITLPENVKVLVENNIIIVNGPKGELRQEMFGDLLISVENNEVKVICENANNRKYQGTMNSLITNMIKGVSEGFSKGLEAVGVGYRFQVQGDKIVVSAGYSHPVEVIVPKNITVEQKSNTEILLSSFDKQLLGAFAANIRKIRKPEPYKGKGIRYKDEHIRRKEGKKAA